MNLRLFDAVIVAAIGILGLKALGTLGSVDKAAAPAAVAREASDPASKAFARVLSNGRAANRGHDRDRRG